jgi:hypothetical protein
VTLLRRTLLDVHLIVEHEIAEGDEEQGGRRPC